VWKDLVQQALEIMDALDPFLCISLRKERAFDRIHQLLLQLEQCAPDKLPLVVGLQSGSNPFWRLHTYRHSSHSQYYVFMWATLRDVYRQYVRVYAQQNQDGCTARAWWMRMSMLRHFVLARVAQRVRLGGPALEVDVDAALCQVALGLFGVDDVPTFTYPEVPILLLPSPLHSATNIGCITRIIEDLMAQMGIEI